MNLRIMGVTAGSFFAEHMLFGAGVEAMDRPSGGIVATGPIGGTFRSCDGPFAHRPRVDCGWD